MSVLLVSVIPPGGILVGIALYVCHYLGCGVSLLILFIFFQDKQETKQPSAQHCLYGPHQKLFPKFLASCCAASLVPATTQKTNVLVCCDIGVDYWTPL